MKATKHGHPISDRDQDRATLREVGKIVVVLLALAGALWWLGVR